VKPWVHCRTGRARPDGARLGQALAPVDDRIGAMGQFLRAELAAGRSCLPAGDHIFRAFSRPVADVRVLIVAKTPTRRQDTRSGSRSQSPPTSGRCPDRCATSTRSSPSTSVSRRPVTGTSPPGLPGRRAAQSGAHGPPRRSGLPPGPRLGGGHVVRHRRVGTPWRRRGGDLVGPTSSRSSRRSARCPGWSVRRREIRRAGGASIGTSRVRTGRRHGPGLVVP